MSLSVDEALRKAKSHARKGEADLAAKKYKSVLEKYPENIQAIQGLKALQQPTAVNVATNAGLFRQQITRLSSDQLQSVRNSYLSGLKKIGVSEPYITDQIPANFCWIGFIVNVRISSIGL